MAGVVWLPQKCSLPGLTDSKKLNPKLRAELEGKIKAQALAWALGFVWPKEIDQYNILQATFMAMSRAVASLRLNNLHSLNNLNNLNSGHGGHGMASLSDDTPKTKENILPGLPPSNITESASDIQGLLIDGNFIIPHAQLNAGLNKWGNATTRTLIPTLNQQAVIKGDSLVLAIAAASVLAKTARDRFMLVASRRFPHYGFANHKGYGTAEHLALIKQYGTCPLHRLSFKGCSD